MIRYGSNKRTDLFLTAVALLSTGAISMSWSPRLSAMPQAVVDERALDPALLMDDGDIERAVERELAHDPAIDWNDIDVEVHDGVVVLTGSADTLLSSERAVRVAETVRGVRSVVSELTIEPQWLRGDVQLARAAEDALFDDPAADSYELDVAVDDGVATVQGAVDSWQERELARRVVADVRGIVGVELDVEVEADTDRNDTEIAADVRSRLRWDLLVDHGLIDVSVTDGIVELEGDVGSAAEKRRALRDAWVVGTIAVEGEALDVSVWERDPELRADKFVGVDDAEIEEAVTLAMTYDSRVVSFVLDAEAANGVVTLTGEVDNLAARRAAERCARNTVGVARVDNLIRVRPAPVADSTVEERVGEALRDHPRLERFEFTVAVHDGQLRLGGVVDHAHEKTAAERVVARVDGVTDIVDRVQVDSWDPVLPDPYVAPVEPFDLDWYEAASGDPVLDDRLIEDAIETELWWSPFVNSADVHVAVTDGVATLTGSVESVTDRRAAVEEAYEGGAVYVRNRILIGDQQ